MPERRLGRRRTRVGDAFIRRRPGHELGCGFSLRTNGGPGAVQKESILEGNGRDLLFEPSAYLCQTTSPLIALAGPPCASWVVSCSADKGWESGFGGVVRLSVDSDRATMASQQCDSASTYPVPTQGPLHRAVARKAKVPGPVSPCLPNLALGMRCAGVARLPLSLESRRIQALDLATHRPSRPRWGTDKPCGIAPKGADKRMGTARKSTEVRCGGGELVLRCRRDLCMANRESPPPGETRASITLRP